MEHLRHFRGQCPFAVRAQVAAAPLPASRFLVPEKIVARDDRFDIAKSRSCLCGQARQKLLLISRNRREIVLPRNVTRSRPSP